MYIHVHCMFDDVHSFLDWLECKVPSNKNSNVQTNIFYYNETTINQLKTNDPATN